MHRSLTPSRQLERASDQIVSWHTSFLAGGSESGVLFIAIQMLSTAIQSLYVFFERRGTVQPRAVLTGVLLRQRVEAQSCWMWDGSTPSSEKYCEVASRHPQSAGQPKTPLAPVPRAHATGTPAAHANDRASSARHDPHGREGTTRTHMARERAGIPMLATLWPLLRGPTRGAPMDSVKVASMGLGITT